MNGFSAGLRQAMKRSCAPPFAAFRRLANALTESAKNITPKREITRSNSDGAKA
jgi:hypothetical protein